MDWRAEHALNHLLRGHDGPQDVVIAILQWSIPVAVAATLALWLLARPRGATPLRLACASALAAAAIGLLAVQVISHIWARPRPFVAHPRAVLELTRHAADPGFPSDHATAAFAIAVSVLVFRRRLGFLYLVAAAVIAIARVFAGVHYPGDVLAGALVGTGAALLVRTRAWPR